MNEDKDKDVSFACNKDDKTIRQSDTVCKPARDYTYEGLAWRKSNIHCCWGRCTTDTRYPKRSPPGTFFIPFPKIGRFKEDMTDWEKNRETERTLKSTRWAQACGRNNFTVEQVNRNTYICSLHFVGGKGPTEEHPNPLIASPVSDSRKGKQKASTERLFFLKEKEKQAPITDVLNVPSSHDDKVDSAVEQEIIGGHISDYKEEDLMVNCNGKSIKNSYEKDVSGVQIENNILTNSMTSNSHPPGNMSYEVLSSADRSKYFIAFPSNEGIL